MTSGGKTMTRATLEEHLFGPPPKRILAIDGGGVRALVALGFLERIECLLGDVYGTHEDFRLADHFDLIGGTSSGALVATGLALGHSVAEVIELSRRLSERAFADSGWSWGLLSPKYESEILVSELRAIVGEETLGSPSLRTGLAIIAKRIDTGSPWVFHNNPRGKFYRPGESAGSVANADLPLYELLRASAAAPTYFEPERIAVAPGIDGLFVDGGVSPFNNPALLMLMMATAPAFGYGWPAGADELNLISVGTGHFAPTRDSEALEGMPSALFAAASLESIITDCQWHAQAILQWLGQSASPWEIDSEAGSYAGPKGISGKLLRYQRYNLILDEDWLDRELDVQLDPEEIEMLTRLDRPQSADRLLELARCGAARQVAQPHLLEADGS